MARIFVTGSTDGLGRAAAQSLTQDGHQVVLHARSKDRSAAVSDLAPRALGVVIGDLSSAPDTRSIAQQVNAIGSMDTVIHNAGIYSTSDRSSTPEGHAAILAVNTLAPYMLTALIERPSRLVYLSSSMHRSGIGPLDDIDWTGRRWNATKAYGESKLYVAALSCAIARRWPDVFSNIVDPGWVPTRMGEPGARTILKKAIAPRHGWRLATRPPRKSAAATGIIVGNRRRRARFPTSCFRTSSSAGSPKSPGFRFLETPPITGRPFRQR